MGQKIFRLPEVVINQIAAGEVVEHPASVVKELIENSLDAKARHISVKISGGGLLHLEIEDDGCGMSPEDAALALERHATSKIRKVDDLMHLSTMGFRGEALAAVSSISEFSLTTSDGSRATLIEGKGGAIEKITSCARNPGTTISIGSLFFNVPARKKFQKSAAANVAQVRKTVEILALAHPHVTFSFFSQGERVFYLPSQEKKERIEAILGSFPHLVAKEGIWGMFGSPQEAKSHRRAQYLFINNRPVFSPLISKAVQMGYGTRLQEHTYPSFVLFVEVDPETIDVNVHPQKKEIRFTDEQILFQRIERAVSQMFIDQSSLFFKEPLQFTENLPFLLEEQPFFPSQGFEQISFPLEVEERILLVMGPYLLMEKGGLWCVDLESAYARILFEGIEKKTLPLQPLLTPLEIPAEEEVAIELQDLGIECRFVGAKTVAVDALPSGMTLGEFEKFVETWKEERRLDLAAVKCCRHGKRGYSFEEAQNIWKELKKCQDSLYDPLGNKIWITMQQADLAIWFTQQFSKG